MWRFSRARALDSGLSHKAERAAEPWSYMNHASARMRRTTTSRSETCTEHRGFAAKSVWFSVLLAFPFFSFFLISTPRFRNYRPGRQVDARARHSIAPRIDRSIDRGSSSLLWCLFAMLPPRAPVRSLAIHRYCFLAAAASRGDEAMEKGRAIDWIRC